MDAAACQWEFILRHFILSLGLALSASSFIAVPQAHAEQLPEVKQYSVQDFFTHPVYNGVIISPTGKYFAIKSTEGINDAIFIFDREEQKLASKFSFGEYQRFSNIRWVNDERIIFTGRKFVGYLDDRGSPPSLYAANADGSNRRELIRWGQSGWTMLSSLPNDKEHILIGKLYGGERGMFAHKLNVDDGRTYYHDDQPDKPGQLLADNSGELRASFSYEETSDDEFGKGTFYLNYKPHESDEWKKFHIDAFDEGGSLGFSGFSKDNRYAYVTADFDTKTRALYQFDTATEEFKQLYNNEIADLSGVIFGSDGNPIAVESMPGKIERHYLTDGSDVEIVQALTDAFGGEQVEITSTTADGKLAVVQVTSDVNPGQYYLFDLETLEAKFIASPYPTIAASDMATVQPITVTARDGLELQGYLTLPNGYTQNKHGALPTIVNVHGGPHGPRDTWGFVPENQFFANRGYAVLQINFRGSGGYGDDFLEAGYGKWGREMQDDVTDATLWAIEEGYAAEDRICIYGGSYGGYASLMGVIREPDLYQCSVGYVGVYSLPVMKRWGDIPKRESGRRYLDHVLGTDEEVLKANSPAHNVDKIKVPLYIVHGTEDVRVPMEQYEALTEALEKEGIPYQSMLKAEGHGYQIEENRFELYESLEAFFDKHIGAE
ncbi:S9 family peptidase [Pseudidiomarina aquimaris]|uniref:S9 family peptidase n=1 Tax=Pseudidiomarina aquimaris TaxID=641841 RepID=A0A432XFW9_9GAMM|nr:S9 family peptidase [Pseudidiomarina aquimaris]